MINIDIAYSKASYKLNNAERRYLNKRLINKYLACRNSLINEVTSKLGYDINQEYFIDKPIENFSELPGYKEKIEQRHVLCMKQNLFNSILNSTKQKFFSHQFICTKTNKTYIHNVEYYYSKHNDKVVPVSIDLIEKIVKTDEREISYFSLSIHILIKGKLPLLAYRLDTDPKYPHGNKFDKNRIATTKNLVYGPHEHNYSEKFAVVYPSADLVGHYDVTPAPVFENIKDYEEYVKRKFNFVDKTKKNIKSSVKNIDNDLQK